MPDALLTDQRSLCGALSVVFVRRQAPDWQGLSRDYRARAFVDPARYVPDHAIPGFPKRVDLLIERWNRRFSIDFFTYRAAISRLSRNNIAAITASKAAASFCLEDLEVVANLARENSFYVYFHDDDDFFAPTLPDVVGNANDGSDAIVTPLFRIGDETYTFVRDGFAPDFILGSSRPHDCRYQSNNYGIHSRHCTSVELLQAHKDHVKASVYAGKVGYTDQTLPIVASATVKTPGSASMLPHLFRQWRLGQGLRRKAIFSRFLGQLGSLSMDETYDWIGKPVGDIVKLTELVFRGAGYDAISDLLDVA
jgi:hypothetical protein